MLNHPWEEDIGLSMLKAQPQSLTEDEMGTLWQLFVAIPLHWQMKFPCDLLRSRWLDMVEAQSGGNPDYTAEYRNAVNVYKWLSEEMSEDKAMAMLYGQTIVIKKDDAKTRIGHAKFYVLNDFIRCFVATGGFRGFVPQARNYTGFMGGSRFREWAPVRVKG